MLNSALQVHLSVLVHGGFPTVKEPQFGKITRREWAYRILKTTVKASIAIVVYFIATSFIGPVSELVPSFASTIEGFAVVFIALMVVSDLTCGTIYHAIFNIGRAAFVVIYLVSAFSGNVIYVAMEGISVSVDISMLLTITVTLSLAGLAMSILEAIKFLHDQSAHECGMLQ
jgi:hypothetical protein